MAIIVMMSIINIILITKKPQKSSKVLHITYLSENYILTSFSFKSNVKAKS